MWIHPIEEHHVTGSVVEGQSHAPQVSTKSYQCSLQCKEIWKSHSIHTQILTVHLDYMLKMYLELFLTHSLGHKVSLNLVSYGCSEETKKVNKDGRRNSSSSQLLSFFSVCVSRNTLIVSDRVLHVDWYQSVKTALSKRKESLYSLSW